MSILEKIKHWINPPPQKVDVGEISAVVYFDDGTSSIFEFKGSSDYCVNQMYAIHAESVFRDWLDSYNKKDFFLESNDKNKKIYLPRKKISKIETTRKEYNVWI